MLYGFLVPKQSKINQQLVAASLALRSFQLLHFKLQAIIFSFTDDTSLFQVCLFFFFFFKTHQTAATSWNKLVQLKSTL